MYSITKSSRKTHPMQLGVSVFTLYSCFAMQAWKHPRKPRKSFAFVLSNASPWNFHLNFVFAPLSELLFIWHRMLPSFCLCAATAAYTFYARCTPLHVRCRPLYSRCTPLHARCTPLRARCTPLHTRCTPLHARRKALRTRRTPLHARCTPLHARCTPLHARRTPLHAQLKALPARLDPDFRRLRIHETGMDNLLFIAHPFSIFPDF